MRGQWRHERGARLPIFPREGRERVQRLWEWCQRRSMRVGMLDSRGEQLSLRPGPLCPCGGRQRRARAALGALGRRLSVVGEPPAFLSGSGSRSAARRGSSSRSLRSSGRRRPSTSRGSGRSHGSRSARPDSGSSCAYGAVRNAVRGDGHTRRRCRSSDGRWAENENRVRGPERGARTNESVPHGHRRRLRCGQSGPTGSGSRCHHGDRGCPFAWSGSRSFASGFAKNSGGFAKSVSGRRRTSGDGARGGSRRRSGRSLRR